MKGTNAKSVNLINEGCERQMIVDNGKQLGGDGFCVWVLWKKMIREGVEKILIQVQGFRVHKGFTIHVHNEG